MVTIILLVVTVVFFFDFFVASRKVWDIVDTPTVSPSGAIIGMCEIVGKAAPPKSPSGESLPVWKSPIGNHPCVWYHILIERYESQGKSSKWVTYKQRSSQGGFRLADQYGSVIVDPTHSEKYLPQTYKHNKSDEVIEIAKAFFGEGQYAENQALVKHWIVSPDGYYMHHPNLNRWIESRFVSPDRLFYFDVEEYKWNSIAETNFVLSLADGVLDVAKAFGLGEKLRVTETVIFPDAEVFVHGNVSVTEYGSDLQIEGKKGSKSGFFVSTEGQTKVLNRVRIRKWLMLAVAMSAFFVLLNMYVRRPLEDFFGVSSSGSAFLETITIEIGIVLFLFALVSIFLKLFRTYNRFVGLREQVRLSRSSIYITQKRRTTLIPQLCEVLEDVMSHEKYLMDKVAKLRSQSPDLASKEIIAIAEAYPNIKSSENFMHMQNELARTEEKIAMSRLFLNDSILAMDNLRATLSGMAFSPLFAKEQRESM